MTSEDRIRELEDKYEGFKVYDNRGEKIGKVDDLFIDDSDREEYVGVKMGLLGLKSTLIPMDIVRVNESDKTLEVSESKDRVKDAPSFDDDEDITPDFEDRIRSHFGLESMGGSSDRGSYGSYSGAAGGASNTGEATTDQSGEPLGDRRGEDVGEGTTGQSGRPLGDTGVTNDRGDETSSTGGESERNRDYGEGTSDQSGSSMGDTGVTNDRSGGGTGSGEGAAETGATETSGKESWDFEETRAADGGGSSESVASQDSDSGDSSGSAESQDSETREIPTGRETTETETFQEGGRTKIRRRIRREEVEFVDEDPNR